MQINKTKPKILLSFLGFCLTECQGQISLGKKKELEICIYSNSSFFFFNVNVCIGSRVAKSFPGGDSCVFSIGISPKARHLTGTVLPFSVVQHWEHLHPCPKLFWCVTDGVWRIWEIWMCGQEKKINANYHDLKPKISGLLNRILDMEQGVICWWWINAFLPFLQVAQGCKHGKSLCLF